MDHRARRHHGTFAQSDALEDDGAAADPDAIADGDGTQTTAELRVLDVVVCGDQQDVAGDDDVVPHVDATSSVHLAVAPDMSPAGDPQAVRGQELRPPKEVDVGAELRSHRPQGSPPKSDVRDVCHQAVDEQFPHPTPRAQGTQRRGRPSRGRERSRRACHTPSWHDGATPQGSAREGRIQVGARARVVAFYLPQFHPIPENDQWWGAGFTEWTNLASARPLFPGHQQPLLPADLGFYDLRLAETRRAQAQLATEYGVEAFAYWHYWFGDGRVLLERPFQEVLDSGDPSVSFCLAWANQSCTGHWHGAGKRLLMEQRYPGAHDDEAHFAAVLPAFRDPRYLTVDGRPVFYVYRPEEHPDIVGFITWWRELADRAGLPGLYLVAEVVDPIGEGVQYATAQRDGFDAGVYVRFPVHAAAPRKPLTRVVDRLRRRPRPGIREYNDQAIAQWGLDGFTQPCVWPNWDNTPRAGANGLVVTGASPDAFGRNLRDAVELLSERPAEHRLLWVNSWNEWAEGNHLEPDTEVGHGWLEAVRTAVADETDR